MIELGMGKGGALEVAVELVGGSNIWLLVLGLTTAAAEFELMLLLLLWFHIKI